MSKRFPFTKRSIDALSPHDPESPSREAEYSDAECIGLKLRVSKNGRRLRPSRGRSFLLGSGPFSLKLRVPKGDKRGRMDFFQTRLV